MNKDFGIYVHWPYCAAKCPYCDFNSHVRARTDETRWTQAISRELAAAGELQGATRPEVTSIFFGGGTPSLMSGRAVATTLDAVAAIWAVASDVEITLEANPNSVEQDRFRDYRSAGVNRISIGVQAFDDSALKFLGRLHGAQEAKTALRLGMEVFPRVSFDLIYARPGQDLVQWQNELEEALGFGTEHLSVYQLTIEKGTAFETLNRQGRLHLPPDDTAVEFYELTQEMCGAAGLPSYEISNHARPGGESRHNLVYWRYGDYVGVGPGAHGRFTSGGRRFATEAERLPERWFSQVERDGSSLAVTDVAHAEAAREHLLMAMRLSEGLDTTEHQSRWGIALSAERIRTLAGQGYLSVTDHRLAATPRGRLILNRLISELAA